MKYIYRTILLAILLASCSRQANFSKTSAPKSNMVASITVNSSAVTPVKAVMPSMKSGYNVNPKDYYEDAYLRLKQMLAGELPESFKKAVFITENAWFENKLNYERYDEYIKTLAAISKEWKKSNPLLNYKWDFDSDKVALNGAIYHIFSDTVNDEKKNIISIPYHYDFNDCFAKDHWENMFVTKLMATHGGNCHSLPFLYKMVAEEAGTDANLCFLPGHIYLNQYSHKTSYYNTELTGKCFPVDAWLMTTGYVSVQSIRTGLYMDTLGIKQSIAVCVNDLAKGYQRKFGIGDTDFSSNDGIRFVLKCCNLGLKYYPNYGELLLLKAETLKKLYQKEIALYGLNAPDSKEHGEKIHYTYAVMEHIYSALAKLDYREIPDALYDRWTKAMINGGKAENENIHDTVVTTNVYGLFGKKTDMIAVSNGNYVELFENDTLRRIGSVMFNNITHKVEYFILKGDEKYSAQLNRPTEPSRFLSIDPMTAKYPMLTPYQYASDRPIDGRDQDGKEWEATVATLAAEAWSNFSTSFKNDVTNTVEGSTGTADYNNTQVPTAVQTNLNAQQETVGEAGVVGKTAEVMAVVGTQAPLILDPGAALMEDAAFEGAEDAAGIFGETKNAETSFTDQGQATSTGEANYSSGDYSNLQEPKNVKEGGDFTPAQRRRILDENAKRNGGTIKSDKSGTPANKPVQAKKGVKADMNQAEVDHKIAKSKGGTNSNSNAQVLTKEENLKKGSKIEKDK